MYTLLLTLFLATVPAISAYQENTIIATIPGFSRPLSLAITPDGNFVYVTDLGSNSANVIATATNTVLSTPLLNNIFNVPQSIAITPNGQYAYVASAGNGSVVVIATATNSVVPTPALFGSFSSPESLAVTPNGDFVYVAASGTNTIKVIQTSTNTVIDTITDSSLQRPDFIAITPDGHYAYVTNLFSFGLTVIDLTTNTVIPTPGLASGFFFPQAITITPNGAYAYVANGSNNNSLVAINLATNTIIPTPNLTGTIPSPVSIAFTPDSRYGYVSNAGSTNNTVTVFDTLTNRVVATIPGFNNPQTIAITPNGQFAYVANVANNTVSVIFIGLHFATNFQGCIGRNIFLSQTEYYNHLTWTASFGGNAPVRYNLYRDAALTELIASIPAWLPLFYNDPKRNLKLNTTYYLVAIDALGNSSMTATTTVTDYCARC